MRRQRLRSKGATGRQPFAPGGAERLRKLEEDRFRVFWSCGQLEHSPDRKTADQQCQHSGPVQRRCFARRQPEQADHRRYQSTSRDRRRRIGSNQSRKQKDTNRKYRPGKYCTVARRRAPPSPDDQSQDNRSRQNSGPREDLNRSPREPAPRRKKDDLGRSKQHLARGFSAKSFRRPPRTFPHPTE